MKRHIQKIFLGALFLLVGCASPTNGHHDYAHANVKYGSRVGLIVDVDETPIQRHVGLLVFSNFEKAYPYRWDLKSAVYKSINAKLDSAGFEVIDLEAMGFRASSLRNPLVQDGTSWKASPGKEKLLSELKERIGLQALIVINKSRVTASMECTGGPCSRFDVEGSGLYTRSKYPFFYSSAVAAFSWNIIAFQPLIDLAEVDPLHAKLRYPISSIPEFKEPKDYSNVSEQEFVFVREAIARFSGQVAEESIKMLMPMP